MKKYLYALLGAIFCISTMSAMESSFFSNGQPWPTDNAKDRYEKYNFTARSFAKELPFLRRFKINEIQEIEAEVKDDTVSISYKVSSSDFPFFASTKVANYDAGSKFSQVGLALCDLKKIFEDETVHQDGSEAAAQIDLVYDICWVAQVGSSFLEGNEREIFLKLPNSIQRLLIKSLVNRNIEVKENTGSGCTIL